MKFCFRDLIFICISFLFSVLMVWFEVVVCINRMSVVVINMKYLMMVVNVGVIVIWCLSGMFDF